MVLILQVQRKKNYFKVHISGGFGTDTSSLGAENYFKVHTVDQEDYGTDTSSLTVTSRYIDHEDYDTDTSSLRAKKVLQGTKIIGGL